ncbi:MAG: hypothetical protein K0R57_123 [Paenibacillaceae bacterium]|jgi:hypothetical protein|nr:hypothetical protein [Paenibacillaceae bacterium]
MIMPHFFTEFSDIIALKRKSEEERLKMTMDIGWISREIRCTP